MKCSAQVATAGVLVGLDHLLVKREDGRHVPLEVRFCFGILRERIGVKTVVGIMLSR